MATSTMKTEAAKRTTKKQTSVAVVTRQPERAIDFQAIGKVNAWISSKTRHEAEIMELNDRIIRFTFCGILLGIMIGMKLAELA